MKILNFMNEEGHNESIIKIPRVKSDYKFKHNNSKFSKEEFHSGSHHEFDVDSKRRQDKIVIFSSQSPAHKNATCGGFSLNPRVQTALQKPSRLSISTKRGSLSKFTRKRKRFQKGSLKRNKESKISDPLSLRDLLFRQKLDLFINNMRAHSGLNDVSRLTMEKLMIINDNGSCASQILSEKALTEREKQKLVLIKNKRQLKGKEKLQNVIINALKNLRNYFKDTSTRIVKKISGFIEDYIPEFKPFGKFKIIWEIIMLTLTIWNLISFTLTLSFGIGIEESFSLSIPFLNNDKCLLYFQILCLILYTSDIFIKFNTCLYTNGEAVYDRKRIFKTYFFGGFLFDVLGTVPFWLYSFNITGKSTNPLYFLLFKLYPLQVFFGNINEALLDIEGKSEAAYQLFKLFLTVLTVCHIFACIWHYQAYLGTNKNWINSQELLDCPWSERYIRSLYFTVVTMTTVGYGDISPGNNLEYFIAMCCMLIGSGLIGYSINSIGAILKKKNKSEIDFRNKMQILNSYLKKNNIENQLKIKVRKYLEYLWKIENSGKEKQYEEILNELPNSLKEELLTQSRTWALEKLFGGKFKKSTMTKLVNSLIMCTHNKEEWIFQESENNSENCLFIIAKGDVDIFLNGNHYKKEKYIKLYTRKAGGLLGLTSFILDVPRFCSAKAASVCTLFKLNKRQFLDIIKENPDDYETYCMIRDRLFLYNDMSVIGKKCEGCGDSKHELRFCPCLTYKPFKNIIIKRHLHSAIQERRKGKRSLKSKRKFFKTLLNTKLIRSSVSEYQSNLLPEIRSLAEYYATSANLEYFPPTYTELNLSDDCMNFDLDPKGRDESKEIISPSKEESFLLEENIKTLYENVPFKYSSITQKEKSKDIGNMNHLTDSLNASKSVKKNHQSIFSLPQENNQILEVSGEESNLEEFLKVSRENFSCTSLKNIPGLSTYQDVLTANRILREERGERKAQSLSKTIIQKKGESIHIHQDLDNKDDYEKARKPLRRVTSNNLKSNKNFYPMFDAEFDKGFRFSLYFPYNNKNNVIDNVIISKTNV